MLFPRAAPRLLAGFAELGENHPPEPHWYLAFVGIDPRQQRRGLGRTLLAPIIERADDAGIACYLETPFPDTRVFYRRLGFEDTDELHPGRGSAHYLDDDPSGTATARRVTFPHAREADGPHARACRLGDACGDGHPDRTCQRSQPGARFRDH